MIKNSMINNDFNGAFPATSSACCRLFNLTSRA